MHPILYSFASISIHTYGVFMALGFALLVYTRKQKGKIRLYTGTRLKLYNSCGLSSWSTFALCPTQATVFFEIPFCIFCAVPLAAANCKGI